MRSLELEAICVKMGRIESRKPGTYMEDKEWNRLNEISKQIAIQQTKIDLIYQKQRLKRMGEKDAYDSIEKIKRAEKFLEMYEGKQKGEDKNENRERRIAKKTRSIQTNSK